MHKGLLYWPFEDPRVSLGWGQIAVTDGADWRVLETRVGRQFHLHGLFPGNPDHSGLLAGGSSWNAQILQSGDRGATWDILWERQREEKRFSRTYNVVTTAIGLVGDLMVFGAPPRSFGTVGRLGQQPVSPIAGWPDDILVHRMTPYRGGVLALLKDLQTRTARLVFDAPLLSGDMRLQSQLRDLPLPQSVQPVDFDSFGASIVMLTREANEHGIWLSSGADWKSLARIRSGEPQQIRLAGKQAVIAGKVNGTAALWLVKTGLNQAPVDGQSGASNRLPDQISREGVDVAEAQRQIADALADPRSYAGHGIRLRNVIDKWVMRGLKGEVLSPYLTASFPEGDVKLIGGRAFASHERFGRWILMWGMRRAGGGSVPVSWLRQPFDEPRNDSAKYFSEPVAAGWTAAAIGQNDKATMEAMLARAINRDQPDWLRVDYEANHRVLDQQ